MLTIPARDHGFSPPCIVLNILYFIYKCNIIPRLYIIFFPDNRLNYRNHPRNENTSLSICQCIFINQPHIFSSVVKTVNPQSERQKTSHRNLLVNNERFWQKYSYTPSPYYRRGGGGGMGGGMGRMGLGFGISGGCGGGMGCRGLRDGGLGAGWGLSGRGAGGGETGGGGGWGGRPG